MRRLLPALLVLCAPASAGAEPPDIALEAKAGCPDRAALVALVEEHAGGAAAAVSARVRVARERGRWIAAVELPDATARRIEGATCAEVLDAAALVIALAIELNPDRAADPDPDRHDPDPDPDRDPDPDPGADVASARLARRAPEPHGTLFRLRAGALGDAGTMPGAALAFTGAVSAWLDPHGLELSFSLFLPRTASVSAPSGEVAPIDLWTVGLRGCREVSIASLCAGGEAGRMSGEGRGLLAGAEGGALWSALSASGWFRRRVRGSASVYAGIEALVAAFRPRFVLDDDTALHRPGRFAARALIGVELDLR